MRFLLLATLLGVLIAAVAPPVQAQDTLPHLQKHGTATQLIVDGAPFLIYGGELGNSSASSADYMRPLWPRFEALNLNTILAPVYWELLEPEEGRFDFAHVDSLLHQARRHDMRLVLLWFGSWKNSMSSYAPAWVKRDQERFPRAEGSDGRGIEILTPFSEANRDADAHAFVALMEHLRAADGAHHTVVMVQVENEIGMIPEARDHSTLADAAFAQPVPQELIAYLEAHKAELQPGLSEPWAEQDYVTEGTWEDVFGEGIHTEELFMAWHFARYVEYLAAAGKAAYPLPMFVNAALIRPGYAPGQYPSAGPLPHLLDVWRAGAPSIDFLAPDIYFPNFVEWTDKYAQAGNPLFIPEAGRAGIPESAANAFYAFGEHDAIGFSPFSIESIADPAADVLGETYEVLAQLEPLLVRHQGQGTMRGVRPAVAFDGTIENTAQEVTLGDYVFHVSFVDPWTPPEAQDLAAHGGLLIALAQDEFIVAGTGMTLTFAPKDATEARAGIESIYEGSFEGGTWQPVRLLNGDQSHQGRHLRLPPGTIGIQRLRLYTYY